jgi:hypothetical protein
VWCNGCERVVLGQDDDEFHDGGPDRTRDTWLAAADTREED